MSPWQYNIDGSGAAVPTEPAKYKVGCIELLSDLEALRSSRNDMVANLANQLSQCHSVLSTLSFREGRGGRKGPLEEFTINCTRKLNGLLLEISALASATGVTGMSQPVALLICLNTDLNASVVFDENSLGSFQRALRQTDAHRGSNHVMVSAACTYLGLNPSTSRIESSNISGDPNIQIPSLCRALLASAASLAQPGMGLFNYFVSDTFRIYIFNKFINQVFKLLQYYEQKIQPLGPAPLAFQRRQMALLLWSSLNQKRILL